MSKELLGTSFKRYEKERWAGGKDCSPAHHWMWLDKLSKLPRAVEGRNDLMCLAWFHSRAVAELPHPRGFFFSLPWLLRSGIWILVLIL